MLKIYSSSINRNIHLNRNKKNYSTPSFKGGVVPGKAFLTSLIKFCEKTDHNPALAQAVIGTIFASILRPVTILSIPGAKKEDKQYAAGKALISGVLGLVFSAIFYLPLSMIVNKALKGGINKTIKLLNGNKETKKLIFPFSQKSLEADAFKFLIKYGSSFVVGAIDAFVLFKLLHPVVHKIFGNKKANTNEHKGQVK